MSDRLRDRDPERGAATVWILVIGAAAVLLFGGLLYDGGEAQAMRSRIDDAAWTIARAAAIDPVVDPASGMSSIDEAGAWNRARKVAEQWPNIEWTMSISTRSVSVTATGSYEPKLLSAIGFDRFTHTSTQTSSVLSGATP